jgi:toluene monooxygenase system protein A
MYLYRKTGWWNPVAGVGPAERDWLEKKYPGWNDTFGQVWDVVTESLLSGNPERTEPATLPMICNMVGLELSGVPGKKWNVKSHHVDIDGRRYHFGYRGHMSLVDRFVAGKMPEGPDGVYEFMSMSPEERGRCGDNYAWAEAHRKAA